MAEPSSVINAVILMAELSSVINAVILMAELSSVMNLRHIYKGHTLFLVS